MFLARNAYYAWRSFDYGDTWTSAPPNVYGIHYLGAAEPMAFQRGYSYNGSFASFDDFHYSNIYVGAPFDSGYQSRMGIGADGETVRLIALCPTGSAVPGGVVLATTRQAINLTSAGANSANVFGSNGWYGPQQVQVSATGDGANLSNLVFVGIDPPLATADGQAFPPFFLWHFNGRIVIAGYPVDNPYALSVYVSDNDGAWFKRTCYTLDNGLHWIS